ncbi:cAMP-dependent protein kinase [Pseudoscourfieldia marina]
MSSTAMSHPASGGASEAPLEGTTSEHGGGGGLPASLASLASEVNVVHEAPSAPSVSFVSSSSGVVRGGGGDDDNDDNDLSSSAANDDFKKNNNNNGGGDNSGSSDNNLDKHGNVSYLYRHLALDASQTTKTASETLASRFASRWHKNSVTDDTRRKVRRSFFALEQGARMQQGVDAVYRWCSANRFFQQLPPHACHYICSVATVRVLALNEVLGRCNPDVLYVVLDGSVALYDDADAVGRRLLESQEDDSEDDAAAAAAAAAETDEKKKDAGASSSAQQQLPEFVKPELHEQILGELNLVAYIGDSFGEPSSKKFVPHAVVALEPKTEVLRISMSDYSKILRKTINSMALSEAVRDILLKPGNERTGDDLRIAADAMSRHSFFSSLPAPTVHGMMPSIRLISVPARGVVFMQGDVGSSFYIIIKGSVSIHYKQSDSVKAIVDTIMGDDGKSHTSTKVSTFEMNEPTATPLSMQFNVVEKFGKCVDLLNEGDGFGERALLSKDVEQRSASAVAREEVELLVVPKADFEHLMKDESAGRQVFNPHRLRDIFQKDINLRTEDDVSLMVSFTRELRFFQNMTSMRSMRELLRRSQHLRLLPNRLVIVQGDIGEHFYVVLSGRISVHVKDDNSLIDTSTSSVYKAVAGGLASIPPPGKDSSKVGDITSLHGPLLRILYMGSSFGEMALLNRAPRTATIVTQEECEFAVISREDYNLVVRKDHERELARKASVLLSLPRVRDWPRTKIMRLCYSLQLSKCDRGTQLFAEGNTSSQLFFLLEGMVRLSKGRKVLTKLTAPETVAVPQQKQQMQLNETGEYLMSTGGSVGSMPEHGSGAEMMSVSKIRSLDFMNRRQQQTMNRSAEKDTGKASMKISGMSPLALDKTTGKSRKDAPTQRGNNNNGGSTTFDVVDMGDRSKANLGSRAGRSAASSGQNQGGPGSKSGGIPLASPASALYSGVEVAQVGRGEVLGLLSAITGKPEVMTAVTLTHVEGYRCDAMEILKQVPADVVTVWYEAEAAAARLRLERFPEMLDTVGLAITSSRRRGKEDGPGQSKLRPHAAVPALTETVDVVTEYPALEGWYGGDEKKPPPTQSSMSARSKQLALEAPRLAPRRSELEAISDSIVRKANRGASTARQIYRSLEVDAEVSTSSEGRGRMSVYYHPVDAASTDPKTPRRSEALSNRVRARSPRRNAKVEEENDVAAAIAAALKRSASYRSLVASGEGMSTSAANETTTSTTPKLPPLRLDKVAGAPAAGSSVESPRAPTSGKRVKKPLMTRWRGWETERKFRNAELQEQKQEDGDGAKNQSGASGETSPALRKKQMQEEFTVVVSPRGKPMRRYELDSESVPVKYGTTRLAYSIPDEKARQASGHYLERTVVTYEREHIKAVMKNMKASTKDKGQK